MLRKDGGFDNLMVKVFLVHTINSLPIIGFYPEFTDTSKKPIVAERSGYVEEKKIQSRV